MALLAPWIAPYDPLAVDLARKLTPPSAEHWMGTDQTGRDIFSRIIWGARPSLTVGVLAVTIGALGGVAIGLTAGYARGWWEQVSMRTMDGLASIPLLIWAIAVVGIVGVGPVPSDRGCCRTRARSSCWSGSCTCRRSRASPTAARLSESRADYVQARRMQGAGRIAIMFGDVLPNCLSPVIVQATLLIAVGIVVEASLSFVGLGVEPPNPSWGGMLSDARKYLFSGEWWTYVFPGLAISLSVIGFNLLGDALREILDPRRVAGVSVVA